MSYDRVLPNPAGLQYDTQLRPSNLLDHKIMNDLPANGGSPYRPDPNYVDIHPNGVQQMHQQMVSFSRPKFAKPLVGSPRDSLMIKPGNAMVTVNELNQNARKRSSSSSGSPSPIQTALKESSEQFCLCQPEPKVPRPRNAFILYRQHYQAMVVDHNPGLANPEISKIIGNQWRSIPEEEKNKWKALAEEEKIRHNRQYPGYRYQPRRSGRDGSSRVSGSGISQNISGKSHCNRCGGRFMHPPSSPMTPFTPIGGPGFRSSSISAGPPQAVSIRREKDSKEPPKPIRFDQMNTRSDGGHTPNLKRRRLSSHAALKNGLSTHRERSPDSPYPMTPFSVRPDLQHQHSRLPMIYPHRQYQSVSHHTTPEPSCLKLPPLQTSTPMTPTTPFSQDGSVEATVMTIPFLNKIKVLAKISPPLLPSFRDSNPPTRGPVIAVDGSDPELVHFTVEYLERLLRREPKYQVRVFDGPEVKPPSENGMGDATVDYLNTISAWHRVSDEVITYVKSVSDSTTSIDSIVTPKSDSRQSLSPRSLVPKAAAMSLNSPAQSSDHGSEASLISTATSSHHHIMPIAIVPRYQLTTADAFACSIPIHDSYAPLDHWQWMASLWRACVGPDITVYIRECTRDELERAGGNTVEIRLQDARTIIFRKVVGSPREPEEKSLKRVGFEIEDFLTQ
ncbi:hypothetical protein N7495_001487 [Penicillium taxi]|uniref:uncharacterized protein n=1 Tax=Penicillium taxi TaxID=168475 RepID=UPI0025459CF8|nr:uncharacterized protein N7495_001487 [Penicillium taxi]KAJ5908805.1 hypothetical protein N7495_001487 [Penicillium taxi]